jgi:hypothetical protein
MEDLLDKDGKRERKGIRRKGWEWKICWIRMREDGKEEYRKSRTRAEFGRSFGKEWGEWTRRSTRKAAQEQSLEDLLDKVGGRWKGTVQGEQDRCMDYMWK